MAKDEILIGSDHAGFDLKQTVKTYLQKKSIPFNDAGAQTLDPEDDYPIFSARVARQISEGKYRRGIVLCGTGIGASIAANRFKGVRAALCHSPEMANMSRKHNDSNVLVLGGRTTSPETAEKIIDAWLDGTFEGGGRHSRRIEQLDSEM